MSFFSAAIEKGVREGVERALPSVLDRLIKYCVRIASERFQEELDRLIRENLELRERIKRLESRQPAPPAGGAQ